MNKPLKFSIVAGAVALAVSGLSWGETLKEVVQVSVETNPNVGRAVKRREAADAATEAAKGGYYPKIDWLLGKGVERSQNTTTTLVTGSNGYVRLNRYQEGMVLNQMIWDGLGVKSEVDRRKAIAESSAHTAYASAEEIALQAIDAYLDVVKNREILGYARDNLKAHEDTVKLIEIRSKGRDAGVDLTQAQARLSLAQSNITASESSLRDSEIAFLKVVGKNPINPVEPKPPMNIPKTVDEAVKIGFANHPTLKSAQTDVEQAQAQRELARSFWSPRLELEASYTNNKNIDGVPGPNRDRMLMLWVKWNLFRGGFDYHRLKETALQIDEATEVSRNTNRQVENAVRLAYNAFSSARDRLPNLDRYVKSSEETRKQYALQFQRNARTLLDLLDSENEYYTSRKEYITAKFIDLSARYRVLNAMGMLLAEMDVNPPEQAVVRTNK
jgi:adhesin transport system outer membrane protein